MVDDGCKTVGSTFEVMNDQQIPSISRLCGGLQFTQFTRGGEPTQDSLYALAWDKTNKKKPAPNLIFLSSPSDIFRWYVFPSIIVLLFLVDIALIVALMMHSYQV